MLRELNLEDNLLGDAGVRVILTACLRETSKISKLNISKNKFSKEVCPLIRQLLLGSVELLELYLHYNSIGTEGG